MFHALLGTADGPMDMPPYGVIFHNMWSSRPEQNVVGLRNLAKHPEGLRAR